MNVEPRNRWQGFWEVVHRAFVEFLKLPILIVAGFIVLAAVTSFIDYTEIGWLQTLRAPIHDAFFRDSQATSDLLSTIASGVITVTSITFSLLLLAVQQAASSLTHLTCPVQPRSRRSQPWIPARKSSIAVLLPRLKAM